MTAIVWFRRDLRVEDHPALAEAASAGSVLPVFVNDPSLRDAASARRARFEESLAALHAATEGALVVRSGDPLEVLPQLVREVGASSVHVTAAVTPYGRRRDHDVASRLTEQGAALVTTGTAFAIPPGTLLTGSGTPYRVYTPFSRAWRDHGAPPPRRPTQVKWVRGPAGDELPAVEATEPVLLRWRRFLDSDLEHYDAERDRPDLDTTSRLSAPLALGEVHPRTLLADVARHPAGRSEGARRFVGELCWREFSADTLWHNPDAAWSDLRPDLSAMTYDEAGAQVEAWRAGHTGFPLVDAGMRQLLGEGWMHNRVRMVTASFLVKDLHVRWQVGAEHFLHHLIDGDLASNSGNWQCVAGTGVDAAPYFRIFNPVSQGLKFDPDGAYVRRWVPELAHLPGAAAHEPWRHPAGYARGYHPRIVDHAEERTEALDRYNLARGRP